MLYTYLAPDYFKNFKCKMGNCRHACCEGWRVSIDVTKYFELLGADCDPELRHRIDCSLRLSDRPSEESYAYLEHGYDGNCRLRAPDGSCSLQNALGESAIPDVCRLYPRGIRKDQYGLECSLANSCEATLELFLNHPQPIEFSLQQLELLPPKLLNELHQIQSFGIQRELRLFFISLMQDRSLAIPQRLTKLKNALLFLEKCADAKDSESPKRILSKEICFSPDAPTLPLPEDAANLLELMKKFCRLSESLSDAACPIIEHLENCPEPEKLFSRLRESFDNSLENKEVFFEHMLTNHMFFSRFPYQDRPHSALEEYTALCAVYIILRFICIGSCIDGFSLSKTVDLCADAFRLIDHTDFESNAIRTMNGFFRQRKASVEALIML